MHITINSIEIVSIGHCMDYSVPSDHSNYYLSSTTCNHTPLVMMIFIPYSGLILRGENFEVFADFSLSSKF